MCVFCFVCVCNIHIIYIYIYDYILYIYIIYIYRERERDRAAREIEVTYGDVWCVGAGVELAELLASRLHGHRPVTLVGFGLGARVIMQCLLHLHAMGEPGV